MHDKECTEHVDEDGDGKCDVCGETMEEETSETGLVAELSKILTTLSPYIDSLKGATADSEIGIDLGIGAFYEYSGDTASDFLSALPLTTKIISNSVTARRLFTFSKVLT